LSRELAPICAKSFIIRLYLILLNDKIFFDVMGLKFRRQETNTPAVGACATQGFLVKGSAAQASGIQGRSSAFYHCPLR
jgi:hypothetical protein